MATDGHACADAPVPAVSADLRLRHTVRGQPGRETATNGAHRRRQRDTPTRTWVLALSGVAAFMLGLDALAVATALPRIRQALSASIEASEWTVNAYTLSCAVLLMAGAAVGDQFGSTACGGVTGGIDEHIHAVFHA